MVATDRKMDCRITLPASLLQISLSKPWVYFYHIRKSEKDWHTWPMYNLITNNRWNISCKRSGQVLSIVGPILSKVKEEQQWHHNDWIHRISIVSSESTLANIYTNMAFIVVPPFFFFGNFRKRRTQPPLWPLLLPWNDATLTGFLP